MIEVSFAQRKKDGTECAVLKFQYWIPMSKFQQLAPTVTDAEKKLSQIIKEEISK